MFIRNLVNFIKQLLNMNDDIDKEIQFQKKCFDEAQRQRQEECEFELIQFESYLEFGRKILSYK